jgi:hypothetical protein
MEGAAKLMNLPPRALWRLALVLAFVCGAAWTLGVVLLVKAGR